MKYTTTQLFLSGARIKGQSSVNKYDFLRQLITEEYVRKNADSVINKQIAVNKDARKYIYDETSYISGITANSVITLQETQNNDGTITISLLNNGEKKNY